MQKGCESRERIEAKVKTFDVNTQDQTLEGGYNQLLAWYRNLANNYFNSRQTN
jgi:hypothetical protein